MIKHIVCFKLREGESVDKAIEVLRSMEGNVPTAKKIEVGKDFLHSARSYDIILQVTINSREELDEYQKDKYHCEVVKKHMHAVVQSSVAVDYDI
jgi:hypothetical protein